MPATLPPRLATCLFSSKVCGFAVLEISVVDASASMFDGDKLIAFVDGMATDQKDLTDEMYEKASMHDEKGSWQMVFGVNTIPSYRRKGYAGELIRRAIEDARAQGRKGLVLTCKDRLIPYYSKFGFVLEGVSESVHGNVVWNQMRLTFPA